MLDRARINEASDFAMKKHEGMHRNNRAKHPIWAHLDEVASLTEESGGSTEEIMAAWLHDTVEDTDTTNEEISYCFGPFVATIVDGLTDDPAITNLPMLERKLIQARRILLKPYYVKRPKKADQKSNIRLVTHDPPLDFDYQKCLDYITGASVIGWNARGVSAFLDKAFDEDFAAAMEVYPELKWYKPPLR